jgi:hypothetical protein
MYHHLPSPFAFNACQPSTLKQATMLEQHHNPDLSTLSDFGLAPGAVPAIQNEHLFLQASQHWQDSQQQMLKLMANAPSVRNLMTQTLKQQLDLDGERVGLFFPATAERSSRRCSLTQACAFLLQQPDLDTRRIPPCRVTGVDRSHRHVSTSAGELLTQLKALGLKQCLTDGWNTYWNGRANGSPLSRRRLAARLYRTHIDAAGQLALAEGTLSAEQLKPLLAVLDPVDGKSEVAGQRVMAEQLALQRRDNRFAKLPGALAISLYGGQSTDQLLYLPTHRPALLHFSQRSELDSWLIRHQHAIPWSVTTDGHSVVDYNNPSAPLEAGAAQLLDRLHAIQLESASTGLGDDIAEQAAYALLAVDQVDAQRRATGGFTEAPDLPAPVPEQDDQALSPSFPLGNPGHEFSLFVRKAALKQQYSAIENMLKKNDPGTSDNPRMTELKTLFASLDEAEQAAMTAASALLERERVFDTSTINTQSTALYQARLKALQTEANIQLKLDQINTAEHSLLEAVLKTPASADRSDHGAAAFVTLSVSETRDIETVSQRQELEGLLVFADTATLQDPSSTQSLLLYCTGAGGGLQRFTNRREMERSLFKLHAAGGHAALQLTPINTDPFEYSLHQQVSTFERRAAEIRLQYPISSHPAQQANALGQLREQTLTALLVPSHQNRDLAYAQIVEQNLSALLTRQFPQWLTQASQDERLQLNALIERYVPALQRVHALHELTLPLVSSFSAKRVDARLREDFSLKHTFSVQLDLPDAVTSEQHFIVAPGAPGTPTKTVWVASQSRSKLSIHELALLNIDDSIKQRLSFMRVEVTASADAERDALVKGITLSYLCALVPELDLAQHYEELIRSTYSGPATASAFEREYHHECLLEPYRLQLAIQGRFALLRGAINATEWQILNIAIEAATPQAWSANGQQIVLLPACLSAGGKDTDNKPTTLSGITFIEEQISGLTLLYLPDTPDGVFLRRYNSLEQARKALFDLCLGSEIANYLAERALDGLKANHLTRITQAVLKNFDGIIGVGRPWPKSTSLPAHLLDAEMGRLILAHRNTSRSNSELFLEQYAVNGEKVFTYLKMAIGVLPIIGTGIGLYDAWNSANQAVAAFRKGDHVRGMAEITMVLQALIDAGADLLSGFNLRLSAIRTRTIHRQWSRMFRGIAASSAPQISAREARHVAARFAGYHYEKHVSLAGLQPDTHGVYRNVYRHADGDFIVRYGILYKVELHEGVWRLSGTQLKSYKQPIALDVSGQWNTHFAVYGTAFNGGLAGGGGVQSYLANRLDPIWPTAIRDRLPRWWVDRVFRRQQALTASSDARIKQLNTLSKRTNEALERYQSSPSETHTTQTQRLDAACLQEIEQAKTSYLELEELLPLSHGNKRADIKDAKSRLAWMIVDRSLHRVRFGTRRIAQHLDELEDLANQADALPSTDYKPILSLLQQRKNVRIGVIKEMELIDAASAQIDEWSRRITNDAQRKIVTTEKDKLTNALLPENRQYLKTAQYLQVVSRFEAVNDVSWFYLQTQMADARARIDRVLSTQSSLPQVNARHAERNKLLEDCLAAYDQFRKELTAWTASYPQHFDLTYVPLLLDGIEKTAERARQAIRQTSVPRPAGPVVKKIFETEQGQLLIGDVISGQDRFTLNGIDGYTENWLPGSHGKYRLQDNPVRVSQQRIHTDVRPLLTEARSRLNTQAAYQNKVEAYARQKMLPVDLEHMMLTEAAELRLRASQIERLAPHDPLVGQLRDKAAELTRKGRDLRIQHSLISQTPTEGYLDYLLKQGAVQIRKNGELTELARPAGGRRDFLQEYEVLDLTQTPAQRLWYAHFHYNKPQPRFDEFVKAHLKTAQQRQLGLQWQQTQAQIGAPVDPVWRGDIGRQLALLHFQDL